MVSALMMAKTDKQTDLLIKAGADVNAKHINGYTALMMAKTAEQTDLLIKAGADVNAKDNDGKTALIWAKTDEQKKILREAMIEDPVVIDDPSKIINIMDPKRFKIIIEYL